MRRLAVTRLSWQLTSASLIRLWMHVIMMLSSRSCQARGIQLQYQPIHRMSNDMVQRSASVHAGKTTAICCRRSGSWSAMTSYSMWLRAPWPFQMLSLWLAHLLLVRSGDGVQDTFTQRPLLSLCCGDWRTLLNDRQNMHQSAIENFSAWGR